MSKPIQPPSLFSPMNYTTAVAVFSVVLILLGAVSINFGLVAIGGLLLVMSGLMRDVQRNYVGLVLLTKSIGQDVEVFKEHEGKIEALERRVEDLYRQHNPMVSAIESLQGDLAEFRREYRKQVDLLKAEDHVLQLEIDKVKNPPYFAGDL